MAENVDTQPPTVGTQGETGPGVSANFGQGHDNDEGLGQTKGEGGSNPDPTPATTGPTGFGQKSGSNDTTSSGRGSPGVGKIPEPPAEGETSNKPARVESGNTLATHQDSQKDSNAKKETAKASTT